MITRFQLQSQALAAATATATTAPAYPLSVNHRIAISNDQGGVAEALVALFKAHHYRAEVVSHVPNHSDVVILLEGLRAFKNDEEALVSNFQAFQQAQRIAKRLQQKGGRLIAVQDTGGQYGLLPFANYRAWGAGLSGLIKTASIEWPKAVCQSIDIERGQQSPAQVAERLFQQITASNTVVECGLGLDQPPMTLTLVPKDPQPSTLIVDNSDVFLVSGGGRGITAACLLALAKKTQARFVLLGRTVLSDLPEQYDQVDDNALRRILFSEGQSQAETKKLTPKQINQRMADIRAIQEIKHTLSELQTLGSEATYLSVDIVNEKSVQEAVQLAKKKFTKISALIHGAGVLADKLIAEQTAEQFNKVFNTKVLGLKYLLAATANEPLKLIGLFSSVSARFGNSGQVAYAMANEVLNKVAWQEHHRRGDACLVKSFNWGPWEMGMVTPQLKELFLSRGVVLLPEQKGVQLFLDELTRHDQDDVEIVCGGRLPDSVMASPAPSAGLGNPNAELSTDFFLQTQQHTYLLSHVINDQVVLPACLVLDWFLRVARTYYPAQERIACRDFVVLQGIRLAQSAEPAHFRVQADENLKLHLVNAQHHRCYAAQVSLIEEKELQRIDKLKRFAQQTKMAAWPWSRQEVYATDTQSGLLFHGPAFHAISQLSGICDQGGTAQLIGADVLNWPEEAFAIDVAAIDAVLQLLLLWRFQQTQEKSLPTRIGKFIKLKNQLTTTHLRCIFHCHTHYKHRFLADAVLLDEQANAYALLENIEMCVANV